MNSWQIFKHNFNVDDPRNKLIKCKDCGKVQTKAYLWDWQRCSNCQKYLYDWR